MANVLVVDDALFMCMNIKQMLERHGHTMIGQASNGIEAIEKYKELNPDVVIMDITMPEMNGIDALRHIKEYDANAKVIICSAMSQQKLLAQAIELGVSNFIVKPFKEDFLIYAVEKAVE